MAEAPLWVMIHIMDFVMHPVQAQAGGYHLPERLGHTAGQGRAHGGAGAAPGADHGHHRRADSADCSGVCVYVHVPIQHARALQATLPRCCAPGLTHKAKAHYLPIRLKMPASKCCHHEGLALLKTHFK